MLGEEFKSILKFSYSGEGASVLKKRVMEMCDKLRVDCILNLGIRWVLASLPDRLNSGQDPSMHMWVPHLVSMLWSREKCFAPAGVECRFAYC